MVIVAGHITVEPEAAWFLRRGLQEGRRKRRQAAGCLDFAITADELDPGRVNIFERWESQAAVTTFRRRSPGPRSASRCLR